MASWRLCGTKCNSIIAVYPPGAEKRNAGRLLNGNFIRTKKRSLSKPLTGLSCGNRRGRVTPTRPAAPSNSRYFYADSLSTPPPLLFKHGGDGGCGQWHEKRDESVLLSPFSANLAYLKDPYHQTSFFKLESMVYYVNIVKTSQLAIRSQVHILAAKQTILNSFFCDVRKTNV